MTNGYAATKIFSEAKLGEIRSKLAEIVPADQLIVTCGSYARREASASSDMDFFSINGDSDSTAPERSWLHQVNAAIENVIGQLPAADGAFAQDVARREFLENYGGSHDDNGTITRRMLYLLEGEYLTCAEQFHNIRNKIISRYVEETPRDHQLAFYMLNDMIRYWRTMTVDYANKTYGVTNPKPWAIRNIKLVFSRKLIYASGLFSVALTADRTKQKKIEILDKMFRMTPVERIRYVCGEGPSERLFQMYDMFLDELSKPDVRRGLTELPREKRSEDPVFRNLKNEGHYFSRELMGLYHRTFHASHPIHMAVVF